jgi:hypothetical protein
MKPCTAPEYLAHGYFATNVEQMRIALKLHNYSVRAACFANWGYYSITTATATR